MVIYDNLLQSVRYDQDIATKPPLLHWLIVLCSQAFGEVNEISSRLPSVFAATVAVVSWTLFLIPHLGLHRSILFFLVLATSGEWYRHAAHARVDMLLASLISLSLLTLFEWSQTSKKQYLFGSGLLMALAALTKGPIGIALPVLTTIGAQLFWKEFKVKKAILLGLTAGLALFPLLAWYSAEMWTGNTNLIDIVLHENLDRLLGKMSSGTDPHSHGPLYLLGTFFIGLLPWSLFAVITIPTFIKRRLELNESQETMRLTQMRFIQWSLLSVFTTVFVFLIPSSKRGVYLLPIYPSAALLLTVVLHEFTKRHGDLVRRGVTFAIGLLGFLCLTVFIARLGVIDLESLVSSPKTAQKLSFYLDLLRLSWPESSIFPWIVQVFPIAIIALILSRARTSRFQPFHAFGLALVTLFVFVKIAFVTPVAQTLSPKRFISQEISDHQPTEVALQTSRMYAEAFYVRQTDPHIVVRDYDDASKFVLFWDEDRDLLPKPLYVHQSEEDIRKPGKHLDFAIME